MAEVLGGPEEEAEVAIGGRLQRRRGHLDGGGDVAMEDGLEDEGLPETPAGADLTP